MRDKESSSKFGKILEVNPSEVQWTGLALGEHSEGSGYLLYRYALSPRGSTQVSPN